MVVRRVGIVGFGNLGKYIASRIQNDDNYEISFVWNRTKSAVEGNIAADLILDDLANFASRDTDIVVEVSHPSITKKYGKLFLEYCDYMVGSPTALCDNSLLKELQGAAVNHGLYVPSGAFWGGEDIRKMSDEGVLNALTVTMRKHPLSLKLEGELKQKNATVKKDPVIIYQGPVRNVCALAPNNTNTMAVAALAAPNLGFDGVQGCLISDPNLTQYHIVEVEAYGIPKGDGSCFSVQTIRKNPAAIGAVTGAATYAAYFASLKKAKQRGPGLHLC